MIPPHPSPLPEGEGTLLAQHYELVIVLATYENLKKNDRDDNDGKRRVSVLHVSGEPESDDYRTLVQEWLKSPAKRRIISL